MTNTQEHERPPVSTFALGWALSATLVVLFVLCAVAVFAFPQTRFSHAWLDLFTQAPVTSMRAWLEDCCGASSSAGSPLSYSRRFTID